MAVQDFRWLIEQLQACRAALDQERKDAQSLWPKAAMDTLHRQQTELAEAQAQIARLREERDQALQHALDQAQADLFAERIAHAKTEQQRLDLHRRNGWLRDEIDRLKGGAARVTVKTPR